MNYESLKKRLPKGSTRTKGFTRISWVTLILPYIEEMNLYNNIDIAESLVNVNANDDIYNFHHIAFETFKCPSNESVDLVNQWYGARGNYAVNVGVGFIWMEDESPEQDNFGEPGGHPHPLAPPGHKSSLLSQGVFQVNRGRKLSEIIDGTSNTVALSEIRTIPGQDTRGALHYGAAVMYQHDFPPNFSAGFDRTRYCLNVEEAPCLPSQSIWRGSWTHNARSAHTGGVNTLMLDSSVRFVSDDVDELLWKQVSTPAGEEVLSGSL